MLHCIALLSNLVKCTSLSKNSFTQQMVTSGCSQVQQLDHRVNGHCVCRNSYQMAMTVANGAVKQRTQMPLFCESDRVESMPSQLPTGDGCSERENGRQKTKSGSGQLSSVRGLACIEKLESFTNRCRMQATSVLTL